MDAPACCFTGHRPIKLPAEGREDAPEIIRLKQRLRAEIEKQCDKGINVFITGMAMGVDIWCAEAVIELRKARPDKRIILMAAVPHPHQTSKWPKAWKERYNEVSKEVNVTTIMCPRYITGCMQVRNRFMVENSGVCIAVYDGSSGGTQYTVKHAEKLEKEVIRIDPNEV